MRPSPTARFDAADSNPATTRLRSGSVTYDWKALAPTRPLTMAEIDDEHPLYVPREGEGALEIDSLLTAGMDQPIALYGAAGAGKSTELAALARLRARRSVVGVLVQLDRALAYSDRTSPDDVLETIARGLIVLAIDKLRLDLSPVLASAAGKQTTGPVLQRPNGFDLLLAAVREVAVRNARGRVELFVDGLEKASGELARRTLANLERLRGEAHVVVVVPTATATGPDAITLNDFHVVSIGAVPVSASVEAWTSQQPTPGDRFLFEVATRRLGVAPENLGKEPWDTTALALRHCVVLSGGLVRTALQLLQKAALYASMRGQGPRGSLRRRLATLDTRLEP